jgi:glycosyltransferase involved in cell wall biosynthesis
MNVLSLVTNRHSPFYEQQTKELKKRGIHIDHVYPRKQSENYKEQQDISRSYIDYLPLIYESLPKSLSGYDLVHANNGKTAPFAVAQFQRPIVLTLWGTDLLGPYRPIVKKSARFCDEVIVRSEEMQEELGRDAHVIPAGVNLDVFKPIDKTKALSEIQWSPEKKHVLFPYRPDRELKRFPLAESVVEKTSQNIDQPIELQVVTDVPHDRMPLFLNAADALLLTSEHEGSPNSVKEAMACNTPVVSTDVGDVKERLAGVTHSGVCQTEDELVEKLTTVLAAENRTNGRTHIQELSLDRIGDKIMDVYEQARG